MTPQAAPESDPHAPGAALARADRRLAMLQALAEMGMALSKDICVRSMDSPYHPELKHDPGRSFASAARAVRLTLVLEMRVEKDIVALCNGGAVVSPGPAARSTESGAPAEPAHSPPERRRPAGSCLDDDARDLDRRDCETDRLDECEFDDFGLDGDFDACVGAIRAGLGLSPAPHDPDNCRVPRDLSLVVFDLGETPPTPRDAGPPNSVPPPCAPSVTARERAPRHLPRKRAGEEYG